MVMRMCPNCNEEVMGRTDKRFCSSYCKSAYHYKCGIEKKESLFVSIDKQLKQNRRILKLYNKAGKATVRKEKLVNEGFNPNFFTHYWKNQRGDIYLFCYEFGFFSKQEKGRYKYVLVEWQEYMNK